MKPKTKPTARKSQKDEMEALVALLKKWQGLEVKGIAFLSELQHKTENKVLKEILEIIKQDSGQHRRVQQFIIDGLTKEAYSLTPEEVGEVWKELEKHDALEQATIDMAGEACRKTSSSVARYMLGYLLADEEKHHRMLTALEDVKRSLYPYGW
jgi:5'-deoxynucleotidase YfbR-like HD superfamily hydrolase